MKRRKFIQNSGVAAGALLAAPSFFTACSVNDPMSRIGLTTVVFRNRFLSTNPNASGDLLTLEKIPEYYRDRFGIYQPEFWSEHFESREPSYLKELKEALDKSNSTLINIQVDTPGKDMSDPEDGKSALAVEEIKEWIDVGAFLGSKMVRGSFMQHSLEVGIKSMKELVKYAAGKVDCKAANWDYGNFAPLGLGDMSEADGSIPGTSTGNPGHPPGSHEHGFDIDIAYYQLYAPDNLLRAVGIHFYGPVMDAFHLLE